MIYRTLFIISTLFLTTQLNGQHIQVVSSSDRAPIEHVAVFNTSRERAAITDSLGMIDLSIFAETDTITLQHPSYITEQYHLKDISGKPTIVLNRKRILIDEYVISASKSRESKLIIPYMVDVLQAGCAYGINRFDRS